MEIEFPKHLNNINKNLYWREKKEWKKRLFSQNMKLKPLPSNRVKKRYIVFHIDKETNLNSIIKSVNGSFKELYGINGLNKANLMYIKWFPGLKKGIVKVNNKQANDLKASLAFIQEIEGEKINIRCIGVSGILKKAINKYIKGGE